MLKFVKNVLNFFKQCLKNVKKCLKMPLQINFNVFEENGLNCLCLI